MTLLHRRCLRRFFIWRAGGGKAPQQGKMLAISASGLSRGRIPSVLAMEERQLCVKSVFKGARVLCTSRHCDAASMMPLLFKPLETLEVGFGRDATRATCSPNRGGHQFVLQIVPTSGFHGPPLSLRRRLDCHRLDRRAEALRATAASTRMPPKVKQRGSPSIRFGRWHR
jgi:hypothetical protein